jgi:large subunit ribosomal protein L25
MAFIIFEEIIMSEQFELHAETRQTFGKGASRRLRRLEDKVPGIMYGGSEAALPLIFNHKQLLKALENEAFYSHILTVQVDGKPHKAVLKDLQRHPYKPRIMHLDLLRITGKEKITLTVPLHFKGEDVAPGVKTHKGIVSHQLTSIEVRCLPTDLPEYIEVDLSKLDLDENFHLSDIKLPKGIEIVMLLHGDDQPVANIHLPREATIESGAPVASEVPAINVNPDAKKTESAKSKK